MSLDCTAYAKLVNEFDELNAEEEISGFTFSHRLNLYWETHDVITSDCDKVYSEIEHNAVFDIYEYSRESILKLLELDNKIHYGDDFTIFLNQLIESKYDKFYMQIF